MKVTFLGATHEVTGSLTLIEVGDKKGIVDCGMEQGRDIFENQQLPVSPGQIDFVLLTHAHIDHSGNLPLLYKNGFRGSVYATAATCSLCQIMLRDCANIQMQEAEWKSRKAMRNGGGPAEPLYDMEDAEGVLSRMVPCDYGKRIQINDCATVRFTDVGHLLGSSCIELWLTEGDDSRKITFSGDIGNHSQPILKDPNHIEDTEYLVMESTYGDRDHDERRPDYVAELASVIQRTLDRGGNVVIPAFAVGRTQELLYFIREVKEEKLVTGHGDFPVYIDSPLAIEATSVFLQCDMEYVDKDMQELIRSGVNPIMFPGLKVAVSQDESKAINEDMTPKVIISASGMCDAGRVKHHLKHNLWRRECTVLFVGYQAEGTLGRLIHDGLKKVKLFNEDIDVQAEIAALPGVSGHADKTGLLEWLRAIKVKPKMVFINHGDPDTCESFKNTITDEYGYKAFAPYSGTCFDLIRGEFDVITQGKPIEKKQPVRGEGAQQHYNPVFETLRQAGERLTAAINALSGSPNKQLRGFTSQVIRLAEKMENFKRN